MRLFDVWTTERNSKVAGPKLSPPALGSAWPGPPGGCKRVGHLELLLCGMADLTSPGATKHVVVMGAGPAGLSAAYELTRHRTPVTVVEKDPRQDGGIARRLEFMGCRFDVGPHRFFSKSAEIEEIGRASCR